MNYLYELQYKDSEWKTFGFFDSHFDLLAAVYANNFKQWRVLDKNHNVLGAFAQVG